MKETIFPKTKTQTQNQQELIELQENTSENKNEIIPVNILEQSQLNPKPQPPPRKSILKIQKYSDSVDTITFNEREGMAKIFTKKIKSNV